MNRKPVQVISYYNKKVIGEFRSINEACLKLDEKFIKKAAIVTFLFAALITTAAYFTGAVGLLSISGYWHFNLSLLTLTSFEKLLLD